MMFFSKILLSSAVVAFLLAAATASVESASEHRPTKDEDDESSQGHLLSPRVKRAIFDPKCVGDFNLPLYKKLSKVCWECSFFFEDFIVEECRCVCCELYTHYAKIIGKRIFSMKYNEYRNQSN